MLLLLLKNKCNLILKVNKKNLSFGSSFRLFNIYETN